MKSIAEPLVELNVAVICLVVIKVNIVRMVG